MVKNIKVKTFLILSFVFVLLVMGVLGGASIYFTRSLADQSITFYEQPHTIQLEVSEIQRILISLDSDIKEAIIYRTPEKTKETSDNVKAGLSEMTMRIQTVKERFTGDEQLLLDADAAIKDWNGQVDMLRSLMESELYDQAVRLFASEYLPREEAITVAVSKISDSSAAQTLEYYAAAQRSKQVSLPIIIALIVLALLLTVSCCAAILKSIAIPLRHLRDAADAMADGNLRQKIAFEGKNEFGQLAKSMCRMESTLSAYVQNIDGILDRIAGSDLTAVVEMDYAGDFAPIKASLQKILLSLNGTISQIGDCSRQVSSGSQQLSSSAQVLSQGASEQASSVEELSASISEVSAQVSQNAGYTTETDQLVSHVGSELEKGNQQMQQMLDAMSEISSASDQIAKIIKTIEDIAFQTNILALNAAVEAARAGAAGKGFAVVADEVRNLAGKSADAAKSTTELIQNSVSAVDKGAKIAKGTAQTLLSVVDGARHITEMVDKIAAASSEQANSISQITQAVDQISLVIQTNSATSEESAAASEELSGQAEMMEHLVEAFQLQQAEEVDLADGLF